MNINIVNNVSFAKLFSGVLNTSYKGEEHTLNRQLVVRRTFTLNTNEEERIEVETTTLDGIQIVLSINSPKDAAQEFIDNFNEETAKELMSIYCTSTMDHINENTDIPFNITGVNYD